MAAEHLDVLVIGAGLSGIGAGYYLQSRLPGKSYAILESRAELGGTWSLFRYPGIRSDSDMYTFGYSFRPWTADKSISDGGLILDYLRETAAEFGIDRHIRYRQRVIAAAWSSSEAKWRVDVETGENRERRQYTCGFLYVCSGYYDYAGGHAPEFPGRENFRGVVVHPQDWPGSIDYAGQRVVVIGSGATAVTLVPALAASAAHVTMLQRSPTYVTSLPARDKAATWLRRHLPAATAHRLARAKNIALTMFFFAFARGAPETFKRLIRHAQKKFLPADYAFDTHFRPSYEPWDQRLCLVPDGDLFKAIRAGRASIVTDRIDAFVEDGIRLQSGQVLPADLVVTATGLKLQAFGGARISVDGRPLELGRSHTYKGVMLRDVPNLAFCVGYTNASWTLRADLVSQFVCRLLAHMDRHGHAQVVPRTEAASLEPSLPLLNFTSGYVLRSLAQFPQQGARAPWRLRQNYLLDLFGLKFGPVAHSALRFSRSTPETAAEPGKAAA
ncbi:flavin-containing monooxygenase [Dokdonella ginsengisoli]|uniref:Flavin-containing monooxygenase n=1 Tax=Dokdonella ginsengisoli TaxID=363846 RepID=A0ABV9R1Q5_9GAMM